ncbi:NAD(P)/FAD-dependent oxidoreductase [Pontibacter qinzhouensis]|uniref:NAD(P)/FAD-dependent oxidoreductase n=1 Tax=Pontibacter qinzhouensis TaxID=2603253 RepID=A0A5C8KAT5_9BACT|nr:NAD(P)/FAD-dependent oxidoreductase [Pontibacter qinzhouensis]TXK47430.1 NAD(P)/FAD-dependent oxidoreductase [Pontibacter qinzhouensis]
MKDIVIIGGGLAGLVSSIGLARQGLSVALVEKKAYPFHRVCGEYVSNEVLPYLASIGADPAPLQPARIRRFLLSAPSGKTLEATLDLGGWGLSRFTLDYFLYQVALQQGVQVHTRQQVDKVNYANDIFTVQLNSGQTLQAPVVLGAYGKRTSLDRTLNRPFFQQPSPYIGVKYHVRLELPKDQIALHNFKDGYAGISAVEDDRYCFCYLTTRQNLRSHGNIPAMEKAVLHRNPHLQHIFREAEFLYEQPEVINEISFATKTCIENHMLMCGDAAGMITPLCGNGMAMAIHAGKLATEQVLHYFQNGRDRVQLEQGYTRAWRNQFATRLQIGRVVQQLFGHPVLTELAVGTLKQLPFAVQLLMRQTHGQPF